MTLIIHEAPSVTELNLTKALDDVAAQRTVQAAERAGRQMAVAQARQGVAEDHLTKALDDVAAQRLMQSAERARQQVTAAQARQEIVADQDRLKIQNGRLNQRQAELNDRAKSLDQSAALSVSLNKQKADHEKQIAEIEKRHKADLEAVEQRLRARLREALT